MLRGWRGDLSAAECARGGAAKVSDGLSTRQLLRLARRAAADPAAITVLVHRMCLSPFMPPTVRASFVAMLERGGLPAHEARAGSGEPRVVLTHAGGYLDIGGVRTRLVPPSRPELVPNIRFENIQAHLVLLREMLRDLVEGERWLLLIGNQGTGKNKLADRLLQLLGRERQYVQLNRDTTIQSLTVTPSLRGGVVAWEDSPLVIAAREGSVLVVDEADKAPLEVVVVLKGVRCAGPPARACGAT